MFRSATDPYLKADSVAGIKAGRTVWGEGIVLSGTTPDAIDDSTHARTATAGANQTWATWPVEFGSGQPWKVPQTEPTTYFMLAEMHWLWTMKCWKHDATHDGKLTCKHEGCDGLLPEEPCQPVDVRLAVSRDSIVSAALSSRLSRTTNYKPYRYVAAAAQHYTRQNSTPAADGRCVGMCDPDARRALIPAGPEGSWYSRGVWANPWPQLTADGQELRVFFHGRNVDNRNRVDPLARWIEGNPLAPVAEGLGYASFRPDGLMGLRAGYGEQGSQRPRPGGIWAWHSSEHHTKRYRCEQVARC